MTSTTSVMCIIRCSKATGSTWCTPCTPASASRWSNVGSQVQVPHADISGRSSAITSVCVLSATYWMKLYKDIRLAIDGRRNVDNAGPIHPRRTPQLDMCHHFFHQLYTSAAEVLPTAPPCAEGDDEYSSQDASDELDGWTPERYLVDVIGDLDPLTPHQLPFFSMSDLHRQFQAWFEVHHGNVHHVETDSEEDAEGGARPHPAGAKMPSRITFSRAWRAWSKVLRLKFPSEHSCCQTCFELREATYRTWSPLHVKLQYARRWRDHLRDQFRIAGIRFFCLDNHHRLHGQEESGVAEVRLQPEAAVD